MAGHTETVSIPALAELGDAERSLFLDQGYITIERAVGAGDVARLLERFPRLYAGDFDTGVFPDEWYWRDGMSLPDVTRHLTGTWKSDLAIAAFALSADAGRAAAYLAGWPGARLALDTIWHKPPRAHESAMHQDTSFMKGIAPEKVITIWLTLDDTEPGCATLEYAPGSHRWPVDHRPRDFHVPDGGYKFYMEAAARAAGVAAPETLALKLPAGSISIHAGEMWHGAGPNGSDSRIRRSIGLHFLSSEARYADRACGYIFGRYRRSGSDEMDESFFPVTFAENGAATPWIDEYLSTGLRP